MKRIPAFTLAVLLAGTGVAFTASAQDPGHGGQQSGTSTMHRLGSDLRGAMHKIGSAARNVLHRAGNAVHRGNHGSGNT